LRYAKSVVLSYGKRVGNINLKVKRKRCFEDAYRALYSKHAAELYQPMKITFEGESGIDAGGFYFYFCEYVKFYRNFVFFLGLLREFYIVCSQQMLDPNYVLFTRCGNQTTFQPDPRYVINGTTALFYFKFCGMLVAKAIFDEKLLDVYFTRSFYKHILGIPIVFSDLEGLDPDLHRSLSFVLLNGSVEDMDLRFEDTREEIGSTRNIELIPNGQNIGVTEQNKYEYVRLKTEAKMTRDITTPIKEFRSGFYKIIPLSLITLFDVNELELLISGLPNIDIDDMEANCTYTNYLKTDKQIIWFWKAVRTFSEKEKAHLIQFITGTSKVPVGGFKNLSGIHGNKSIEITRVHESERLPSGFFLIFFFF
jgi:E3 ubiquitin-protein ligase HUWE1